MRVRRVEVHPKVAGQALPALLQTVMPRLQKDKQLKSDAIQNAENAIADMVSKGEPFAGRFSPTYHCQPRFVVCYLCRVLNVLFGCKGKVHAKFVLL